MLREGLKRSTVGFVTLIVTVLSWGIGRWWLSGGNPALQIGWLAGILLVGMAVIVVVTGSRMWRLRQGRTHVEPVVAARILGLAQASALTGAVMGGAYLGQAIALVPDFEYADRGRLVLRFGLAALGGVLMAAGGLLVQSWCRISDDDEDEDEA